MIKSVPFAVAGPCSAETREQLYETCKGIKEQDITMLRAGIWKPRTRPGSFEGVGEEGLKWFKEIKEELEMPITVEVANTQHVELALKYNVDVLWLGARSTVNPFTVQEIADALKGVDVPVMIKNPINPDLALWIGAIERIYNSGIRSIAAIHRGFSSLGKSKFRNEPVWSLAIELKSKLPNIPLICDPSHIGGNRDLIYPISQKAIDLSYSGLMIETHMNPDEAWSDAAQQVTPATLGEILYSIQIRKEKTQDSLVNETLEELRKKVDELDYSLLEVIASRQDLVERIGEYKKDNNMTVFQPERWLEIFNSRPAWGSNMSLDKKFVEEFCKVLHNESIRLQTEITKVEA